jgi:hypothetical protein
LARNLSARIEDHAQARQSIGRLREHESSAHAAKSASVYFQVPVAGS